MGCAILAWSPMTIGSVLSLHDLFHYLAIVLLPVLSPAPIGVKAIIGALVMPALLLYLGWGGLYAKATPEV